MPKPRRRPVAVLLLALAAGCGGGDCTLAGKVKFQGRPVASGTVIATGSDGIRRTGNIGPDGSYSVEKLPPGPVKLAVESPEPPDPATWQPPPTGGPAGAPRNLPPADRSKWIKLPEQYGDADQSGLATTVQRGTNPYDIEMP
jgi:hypothetical protein